MPAGLSTAGRVARKKPVVVYKAGRISGADNYTQTHTEAPGSFKLYRKYFAPVRCFHGREPYRAGGCLQGSGAPAPAGRESCGHFDAHSRAGVAMIDHLAQAGCVIPSLHEGTIDRVKGIIGDDNPRLCCRTLWMLRPGLQPANLWRSGGGDAGR